MSKTKEEVNGIYKLSDEELGQVSGGKEEVVNIIPHSEDDLTIDDYVPDDIK